MRADVAIVGGGPAGLAASIGLARRGLSVVVLEKRLLPADKACGEGVMPSGVRALDRLGARALIAPSDASPFEGIRYVQEDGSFAEARFADGAGLGIRRPALVTALASRASQLGVILRENSSVSHFERTRDGVSLALAGSHDDVRVDARMLIAADGLASPLRHAAGLDAPARGARRFGLRQHFACASSSAFVEVHFSNGVEAYVTPAGAKRVGVAFLWEDGQVDQPVSFQNLITRFPKLRDRFAGIASDSTPRGAGPLLRSARARTADRFALLGDAGGYVDAITGEGLSLAFHCAEVLSAIVPDALASGATRESLRAYEREFARAFRRYSLLTRGVLALSRRPTLRRAAVQVLSHQPRLFEAILGWVAKEHSPTDVALHPIPTT